MVVLDLLSDDELIALYWELDRGVPTPSNF